MSGEGCWSKIAEVSATNPKDVNHDPNLTPDVKVYPATAERWNDLETLFGPNDAYAGCWCMFWRLDRADFKRMKGEGTKAVLKDTTGKDEVAGLLAYQEEQPIGWCSIGPREGYLIDLQTDKLASQTLGSYARFSRLKARAAQ